MSKISILAQAILDDFTPKYKSIGWTMVYEFEPEGRGHVFYTHPIGTNKERYNIRVVAVFTDRTVKTFGVEFTEVLLQVVLGPDCFVFYEPNGDVGAVFFDKKQFNEYEQKLGDKNK